MNQAWPRIRCRIISLDTTIGKMAAGLAVPIMPNKARMPDGPIEKGGLTAWKRGVLEILGWWVRRVTGQIGTEVVS